MSELRAPVDRKALWVVRELGLPAVIRPCVSCRADRHHATGKFRVNASGKLLDVWLLIGCDQCDRTSKIPLHERIHVQALDHRRLLAYEANDPTMIRRVVMDSGLAGRCGHRLDWAGAWTLDTDTPFYDGEPLEVFVRFELPAPIRVVKLLMAGLGLSRSAVRALPLDLPVDLDARVREDFTFLVTG
ncbi:DUF1062 domain-containing protein [Kutzneria sp. NPDC052558]|uniref:DUF1062 domain-containing protein n=1 Tax=Kutzneria sp. NPDC052558 TaxID=3364121 RepID=UPI0037C995C2